MKYGFSLLLKLKMKAKLKHEGENVKKLRNTVLGKWSHVISYLKLILNAKYLPPGLNVAGFHNKSLGILNHHCVCTLNT